MLPPVTRPTPRTLNGGRRQRLRQARRVAGLEAGNINSKPDALSGITALSRIGCLSDLGLCCAQATPQGIGVRLQGQPDRSLDKPAVQLGQAQVLRLPRVNQRVDQNRVE